MIVVFGLGTRLHFRMRTKFLHNGQQPWSVVIAFIDQSKFEAMKMLSDRRALRCDKNQFRAKMTVST